MKFNVQSILPSVRSGTDSDFELNRSDLPEAIPLAHNALRASLMYLVAAAIAWAGEVYLALEMRAWQVFVLAGIGTILLGMAVVSVILVRRGRFRLGVWWLIGASLTSLLATPFLIAGFGLILGLGTILVVLAVSLQTLPPKEVNWALLASVAVACAS